MSNGQFVISLDFELFWGVRDKKTVASYGENIAAVHQIIPRLLDAFAQHGIAATFSTVGLLFFRNKEEMLSGLPELKPSYVNNNLSPYTDGYLENIGISYPADPYHYAPHLIELIQQHPIHEIGTHTFCHYYCLEAGQTAEEFRQDLRAARLIAEQRGIKLTSLIFPRNQFNTQYLDICKQEGIFCYRGNEASWLYTARNRDTESKMRRGFRLMDAYFNLSGENTYSVSDLRSAYPINIPASRFLRPYNDRLKYLDGLRLARIEKGMTHAAKTGTIFHLWWHPHNFGDHTEQNFSFLEKILTHYGNLKRRYNFESITMTNLAKRIVDEP